MEMYLKDIMLMVNQMARVSMFGLMDLVLKVILSMAFDVVMVNSLETRIAIEGII